MRHHGSVKGRSRIEKTSRMWYTGVIINLEGNMGTVYFTRHGQTVWNVENKLCGATDIPLTQLGHQQALALGERLLA